MMTTPTHTKGTEMQPISPELQQEINDFHAAVKATLKATFKKRGGRGAERDLTQISAFSDIIGDASRLSTEYMLTIIRLYAEDVQKQTGASMSDCKFDAACTVMDVLLLQLKQAKRVI